MVNKATPILNIPALVQKGDITNCGPTAAAMLLGFYEGHSNGDHLKYQENIGRWSWDTYSVRRFYLSLGGSQHGPGGSPPFTMVGALNRIGEYTYTAMRFDYNRPMQELREHLNARRPVMVLVNSGQLWGGYSGSMDLHWVVVAGVTKDAVVFMDPSGGVIREISHSQFEAAWKLNGIQSLIFDSFNGIVGP